MQSVCRVPAIFFAQVDRNRTCPFWKHPSLIPLDPANAPFPTFTDTSDDALTAAPSIVDEIDNDDNTNLAEDDDDDDEEDQETAQRGVGTFRERMEARLSLLKNFIGGLEYQIQFQDERFMAALERDGGGFLRLAENCLDREHRFNTTRGAAPTTWERGTSNAMFYRTRPPASHAS